MIRIENVSDSAILVSLDDLADWEEFARQNNEALIVHYGSIADAYEQLASYGGLTLGGGAMAEIGVIFRDNADTLAICRKWIRRLGAEFHPDIRARDYEPPLTQHEAKAYTFDMAMLCALAEDPYAVVQKAWEKVGGA